MKRAAPWILLCSFYLLGTVLLVQMHKSGEQTFLVHQSSQYAIIDLSGEEAQEWFDEGNLQFLAPDSNAKTLIRVRSGGPSRITGKLKSNGEILLINPAGIIVGPDASINLLDTESTLDPEPSSLEETSADLPDSVELTSHGNVYAIAIRNESKIRASTKRSQGGVIVIDPAPKRTGPKRTGE